MQAKIASLKRAVPTEGAGNAFLFEAIGPDIKVK
jgi:hypothetical protein